MKVNIDDKYEWVFMRSDGKAFDANGKEIKWIPIEEHKDSKKSKWKPIDKPVGVKDEQVE